MPETQSDIAFRTRSGGFKSPYIERELDNANEDTKLACRARVADFILKNHDKGNLRLLSLPSLHWRFEHMLDEKHTAKCEFVGVERDIGVIRKSCPWMPGTRQRMFDRGFTSLPFAGACSDRAWLIHMDVQTFVRLGQPGILTPKERSIWHCYRGWSAIWLDFTSQISSPIELSLPKLGAGCDAGIETVPVAVTFMKGRESRTTTNTLAGLALDREDHISHLLSRSRQRTFESLDSFEYVSSGGTAMVTIMGRLVRRPEIIIDPELGDRDSVQRSRKSNQKG